MNFIMMLIGVLVYQGLMLYFSKKARSQQPLFHLISMIVLYLALWLLPFDTVTKASLLFFIISMLYYFVYRLSVFSAAIYTFLIFFVTFTSAMLDTYFTIWFRQVFIDYRMTFNTTDFLYVLGLVFFSAIIATAINRGLIGLGEKFNQIKQRQSSLYVTNFILVFIMFIFLRFAIETSVDMAKYDNSTISMYMIINMTILFIMDMWFVARVNSILFSDEESVGSKTWGNSYGGSVLDRKRGLDGVVKSMSRSARGGRPMTVAFVEVSGIGKIKKDFGVNEANRVSKEIINIIRSYISEAIFVRMSGDEFVICLENKKENQAIVLWNDIEYAIRDFNNANYDRYSVFAYAGFVQFDPARHRKVSTLLKEAKSNINY